MPDVINQDAVKLPHRMSPVKWATCALFMLLLLIFPFLHILGQRGAGNIENRAMAEPPEFYWDNFATIPYWAQWGAWGRDYLPFRAELISANAEGNYEVFDQLSGSAVVRGKNGYYFSAGRFFQPCDVEKARMDGMDQALTVEYTIKHLENLGYEAYFMAPPFKASVYPELLPDFGDQLVACNLTSTTTLREHLNEAVGDRFIDVLPGFLALKDTAEEPLFMPLQTHWDSYLGLKQAEAIVETIQPGLWEDGLQIEREMIDRPAELPALAGMEKTETVADYKLTRTGVDVTYEWKKDIKQSATGYRVATATADRPGRVIPGKTIIIHDSFMLDSAEALSNYFEELWLIRLQDARRVPQLAAQLEDADRIIIEAVEDRTRGRIYGELSKSYLPESLAAQVETELAAYLADGEAGYAFPNSELQVFGGVYQQTLADVRERNPNAPIEAFVQWESRLMDLAEAEIAGEDRMSLDDAMKQRDLRRAKVYVGNSIMDDAVVDEAPLNRFEREIEDLLEDNDLEGLEKLVAVPAPDPEAERAAVIEDYRERMQSLIKMREGLNVERRALVNATDDEAIARRQQLTEQVRVLSPAIRDHREAMQDVRTGQ